MDHENRRIVIDHEHHLKQSPIVRGSPNQELFLLLDERIGLPSAENDGFRFSGPDSMFVDVLFIPAVPAEIHRVKLYI